ncbi:MAG: hypothetical protein FRX49_12355 [Trebouxia sp. A1-2]|nr:MAG: hypothetical protein FRX49_12355 [Trebouxia sp. A1-2]
MSATSSPGGSPAKPTSKSQLPASIANASLEDLQKLFVDSLKRLKAKDKKIAELSSAQDALQQQLSQSASTSTEQDGLRQQLETVTEEAKEAQRLAEDAQEQFEGLYKSHTAQQQQLEDAAVEKTIHAEQMASLKEVLRTMAQEKDSAEKEVKQSQDQNAELERARQASQSQAEEAHAQVATLQKQIANMQNQLHQALSQLDQTKTQHQQKLQSVHVEHESAQEAHAAQISQLEMKLSTADEAHQQASATIRQLQAQADADTEEQAMMDTVQQQHAEALAALQSELAELHSKLEASQEASATLHAQLDAAITAKEQQSDQASSLHEEIASLKQELRSHESTPDISSDDLQQQLDSAKADAAKQASKLAQAEMRASLIRQQLQEAQHQLRQFEEGSEQQPRAEQLQESLDKAHSELSMLQGRLSPTEGQMSTSSSENGIATPSSPNHIKVIINVASGETGPEPPSVFYAEQKRTKQKLTSLKAEKQQLQKEVSSMQHTIEQQQTALSEGPGHLADAIDKIQGLEQEQSQLQHTLTDAKAAETQLRSQLTSSEGASDKLRADLTELQQAVDSAQAESNSSQQQLKTTRAQVAELQDQLTDEQSKLQDAGAHSSQLCSELEHAQAESQSIKQRLNEMYEAHEAHKSSAESAQSKLKHQLKAAEIDRETLQQQISVLQEALIKAQHRPSPPASPQPLQPAAAERKAGSLKDAEDARAALQQQLTEAQETGSHAAAAAQAAADAAQAEAQQLKSELKTLKAAMQTLESERATLEEQLAAAQEDASKAQDAATAVASLEGQLQQANRREEQLRASRAQCEYQLQAGEEAQALLKPGQPSAPNSGMVSPAKSEFSDDQDFNQSVSSEAMQKQLDWLLAKLMTAETASATDEAGVVINGNDMPGSVAPRPTSPAAHSSDQHDNGVHQGAESAEMPVDFHANTHHSVGSLNERISQLQSELATSQEKAEEADALRRQVARLKVRLEEAQDQIQEVDSLRQQLADTQAQASSSPPTEALQAHEHGSAKTEALQEQITQMESQLAHAQQQLSEQASVREELLSSSLAHSVVLEQQLENAKAQASSAPSQAEMPRPLSPSHSLQQSGQQSMEQPSASMTIAEADLVEAASNAIQAQVSPSEGKADEDISRDELAVERARLASELADAKRKFMAVAKRKQQEYGKKIKELEDTLAAAQQLPAQLQAQLATAAASAQSQSIDLATAQSRCMALTAELEALQSQLAQARAEQGAAQHALVAQQALMTNQEQQRTLQEEEAKKEMATAQEGVAAAHKEVEAERDRFKKVIQELKKKLDRSSKESMKAEVAAAEARGKAEAEKAGLQTALDTALSRAEAEQSSLQSSIHRLETETKDYKARAHTLLRQKEMELSRARESAAQQFQADVTAAEAATQRTQHLLEQAQADLVSSNAEWEHKLEGMLKQHQDTWSGLRNRLEQQDGEVRSASLCAEQYKAKCVSLEQRMEEMHAQQPATPSALTPLQQEQHAAEVQQLQHQIHMLLEEADAFRATASSVAEAKDAELENVLASNARLRQDLASLQHVRMAADSDRGNVGGHADVAQSTFSSPELPTSFSAGHQGAEGEPEAGWHLGSESGRLMRQGSTSSYVTTSRPDTASQSGLLEQLMSQDNGLQESALLRLAERQAGREEELADARKRAEEAEVKVEDLAQDLTLLQQQVAALKEVCQELERQAGRAKLVAAEGSVDLEYLKNIMLKLYETGELTVL